MHTGGTPIPKFEFSHNYINIGGIWWHFGGVFRALVARGGAFPFFSHRGSTSFYKIIAPDQRLWYREIAS